MVRTILCLASLFISVLIYGQDRVFVYENTLRASATLAPGFMLNQEQTNIYVHGHLEYFPEDRVSLRGDGYWFTGAQQKPALLKENSNLLFGGLYHFHKNRLDYFIGLQAGINFTRPAGLLSLTPSGPTITSATTEYPLKPNPCIAPLTGFVFYPARYVNFFLEARYVSGRYFGYANGRSIGLSEIRISAGLGFQLNLKKQG